MHDILAVVIDYYLLKDIKSVKIRKSITYALYWLEVVRKILYCQTVCKKYELMTGN
ncbi:hypothetical protein acsn021_39830 [Anaerocolumna cellulosilytica]|uniref:Uncharacterized protein n=1 Tax=Anaerocolumna cellulosilytica TaxID=433286 RepID=A0A6S6R0H4_9FIRM|nr:hypothetical protein acsn021_39830 [Anaerocolumna cellulosilytica]